MTPTPSRFRLHPTVRAVALYVVFLGAAWVALRLASVTPLGVALGPLAAQAAMALTILVGSRTLFEGEPAPRRMAPRRRLQPVALVLIALGGFLFQVTVLAGGRLLTTAGDGSVPEGAVLGLAVLLVSSVIGAPLLEEVFFRGMLQPVLSRRNVAVGLVLTAALFGAAHGFQTPMRAFSTFLQGLVLGGLMLLTGRLRAAMIVHALNNGLVLLATVILVFRPTGLLPQHAGGAHVHEIPVLAVAALLVLGMGFYRLAREPRLASEPAPNPAAA